MNSAYIRKMIAYNAWAHRRVWECIMALSEDEFVRDLDYSVGSIRNQVVHVMSVDQRWLARAQETEVPAHLKNEDFTTREAARVYFEDVLERYRRYTETVTDTQLAHEIRYHLPQRGGDKVNLVWEILAHVVNHGTDHRAQILAMLHRMGKATVEQDLMFYLWD